MMRQSGLVRTARRAMAAASIRNALAGHGRLPTISLQRDENGAAEMLVLALRPVPAGSPVLRRLRYEIAESGVLRQIMDGLTAGDDGLRIRCAQLAGALRIEEAVPWLGSLLGRPNDDVQNAAARALGRLGGARSADALVRALYWRRGVKMRVVLELARCAPDHYLEAALFNPELVDVRQQVAFAIGLRRRKSSTAALLRLQAETARNERAAACRALGAVGDRRGVPGLVAVLDDPWWQVRVASVKALGRFDEPALLSVLAPLLDDRNADVRIAAGVALRRLQRAHEAGLATRTDGRSEVA
ncbi:MAG: HEAT repeat domain-containing protein [Chloroflexi bacterium]|nr:MAG: HEAT repeat domain-containing protein [Chloroflexota bacterium]